MSAFEVIIFALNTLREKYECEFEIVTDSDEISVTVKKGIKKEQFELPYNITTIDIPEYVDMILERAIEKLG